jgi:hypothetical protein
MAKKRSVDEMLKSIKPPVARGGDFNTYAQGAAGKAKGKSGPKGKAKKGGREQ